MSRLRESVGLQWLGTPPGRIMIGLQLIAAFVGLIGVNVPGWLFLILIGVFWVLVVVAAIWLTRLIVSTVINRRLPREKKWLAVPTLLVVSWLALALLADKHLVLRFARPWVEHDVKQLLAKPLSAGERPTSGWLGPVPVTEMERVGDTLYFQVAGSGFLDTYGYAWSATTPAPSSSHPTQSPVLANWWEWHWEF